MILLRRLLGDVLRRQRQRQGRTLREVSSSARVSLGYLSEVERGQKEASSELLSAICDALDVRMSEVMREVSDELSLAELAQSAASESAAGAGAPDAGVTVTSVPCTRTKRVTIKAPRRRPWTSSQPDADTPFGSLPSGQPGRRRPCAAPRPGCRPVRHRSVSLRRQRVHVKWIRTDVSSQEVAR